MASSPSHPATAEQGRISIHLITQPLSLEQLLPLYVDAGWAQADDSKLDWITRSQQGCFCMAAALHNGQLVAMAKALSDGVTSAYIHEVTVLKSYRGQKLGQRVVEAVLKHLDSCGIDWVRLICDRELIEFYRDIDFEVSSEFVMVLREA